MWQHSVELDRPQMKICCMSIACWIPKATGTHSEYVIISANSLQQWLQEPAPMLRCTYIACLFLKTNAEHTNSLCAERRILEC